MGTLFNRRGVVSVGDFRFEGLDFRFSVTKALDEHPNTASIQIFNLREDTRKQIEEKEDQRVRIEAGYKDEDGFSVIFEGDLRKAGSRREGPDIVTSIEAGDAERTMRRARVNLSFGPGTTIRQVGTAILKQIKVGVGNALGKVASGDFEGLGDVFLEGVVVSGSAATELTGILKSAGLEWSVQDGNIQILKIGEALGTTGVKLSASTGLVDSPSIDSEGVMSARSLLIPDILPGRKIEIDSEFVSGVFRVEKAAYTGDTSAGSQEWFVDIQGKAPA